MEQRSRPFRLTDVWWNQRLTQGLQITLNPAWIGWTASARMLPSPPVLHFQDLLEQLWWTMSCIPPGEWGTWFLGTWNSLCGIHLDPHFWTLLSLWSLLYKNKHSLWDRNTKISWDICGTSPCWQRQNVPVARVRSKHPPRVGSSCWLAQLKLNFVKAWHRIKTKSDCSANPCFNKYHEKMSSLLETR